MAGVSSDAQIMAAIDFGTANSGYAYSYQYNQDKVYVNSNWSSSSNLWKVPTAILFDGNQKFVAFGEEAENRYCQLSESDEEVQCYYFNQFKMMLYNKDSDKQRITRLTDLVSQCGKTMKAITVFSEAIRFLKDHLIDALNQRNACNEITVNDIMWVLTVPAIWSDAAKQFMRLAGETSGIPPRRLLIALEPECASLYCRTLPAEKLPANIHFDDVGAKYMVLDCGGGTVDITVHEIVENGKLKELYKATGGAWGGSKVGQLFEEYLNEMFGSGLIQRVKKEYPSDWVAILREFEQQKRVFGKNMAENCIVVKIQRCISDIYEEIYGITLETAFKENKITGQRGAILRRKTRLQIPSIVLMKMIETVSLNIQRHVAQLMDNLADELSFIIMVGGFANSPVLVDEVKSVIQGTPMLIPEEAELSVVKGAVLFGWKPKEILSRKSKYSYGISVRRHFKVGLHTSQRKIIDDDGITWCDKVFDTLVNEMQEVKIGQIVNKTYKPPRHNATKVRLSIYYTTKKEVKYTDEDDCLYLGKLTVPMPDMTGDKSREVKVLVTFGDTEFKVDAEDITSGSKVNALFDFLC